MTREELGDAAVEQRDGHDEVPWVPLRRALVLEDREHAIAKVVVALTGSAGTHYVFEHFLRVPLPDATLPALRSLGF